MIVCRASAVFGVQKEGGMSSAFQADYPKAFAERHLGMTDTPSIWDGVRFTIAFL